MKIFMTSLVIAITLTVFGCKSMPDDSELATGASDSLEFRTHVSIGSNQDRTAFPDKPVRYVVDRVVESNRGVEFVNVFVREYVFKEGLNPFSAGDYVPDGKYKMNITCRDLSGTAVNKMSVKSDSLLSSISSDYSYAYSLSECRRLKAFLLQNDVVGMDLFINPSEGVLAIHPSRR